MLTRIRLPAKKPCRMYNLWLVSWLFRLSNTFLLKRLYEIEPRCVFSLTDAMNQGRWLVTVAFPKQGTTYNSTNGQSYVHIKLVMNHSLPRSFCHIFKLMNTPTPSPPTKQKHNTKSLTFQEKSITQKRPRNTIFESNFDEKLFLNSFWTLKLFKS